MRGFLKLRTPFETEIIQDFYNHGATKTCRVLGTFKNNLLLWAPLPSNYNTSVGVQSLSTSPATVNCLSCQQGAYAFSPRSLPRCHTRAGLSNFPESWQGHCLAAGSFLRPSVALEHWMAQAPKKGTRMEQTSKRFVALPLRLLQRQPRC